MPLRPLFGRFRRLLAPYRVGYSAAVEILLLPGVAVALGVWLNPADPFFAREEFPWIWLAPLVLALRYGPMVGLLGAAMVFLLWFGLIGYGTGWNALPKSYFLGGLITVMLAAEFSSVWRGRVRRAESMQDYLDERLDGLTRNHYLLRLSHDRLEQELLSRPVSMRDALTGLRALVGQAQAGQALPAASEFLRLTAQYCQVDRAALVPLRNGKPSAAEAVFLGEAFEVVVDDPLVRHAERVRVLVHVAIESLPERLDSRYIAVAPVSDARGEVHALMLVHAMPFFALQEETLQMLNLMLGFYGDDLSSTQLVSELTRIWPDCPQPFALELQRLIRLRVESAVPSMLVALSFAPNPDQSDLPEAVARQRRALDVSWLVRGALDQPSALLVVMPLAGSEAVDGYLARLSRWIENDRGIGLDAAGIRSRSWRIGDAAASELLAHVLEACDVADQARDLRRSA